MIESDRVYLTSLSGKSVILVGPADYLVGSGLGDEINSYDLVVRMNLSCPVPEELKVDLGSRTDILYHICMTEKQIKAMDMPHLTHTREQTQSWADDGVKWLVSKRSQKTARVRKMHEAVDGIIRMTNVMGFRLRMLEQLVDTNPNMSTVAIYHIMQSKCLKLRVIGCDFHRSGYFPGYGGFSAEQAKLGAGSTTMWGQTKQPERPMCHDVNRQLKFLSYMLQRYKRLEFDEVLMKIVEDGVKCQ